ncbi:RNA polymerase sigma factor [Microlunatus speluncae]|uniref:RNA polymerase sigma factor n=1 Tax=Microlunatus speluncae TaxID=2594267 RepID=UPI0012661FE8|nr:RNA polymerase sigma factor [Microlunatus speluncae]
MRDEQRRDGVPAEPAADRELDDSALWQDLRGGDRDAFRSLFLRHSDAVYNFAFRRTSSWAVADDVVQATFGTLWRRVLDRTVDELRLPSARPVLFAMARNECSNQLRSGRRQTQLADRIEAEPGERGSDDVDDWVSAEATMQEIARALRKLPRSQREVIELVGWSELSLAEAGETLGVPVGTVKSRLKRARDRLLRTPLADLLRGAGR